MTAYATSTTDPTNVVGRRIGAYAIDSLLMLAATLALIVPLFLSASEVAPSGSVECASSSSNSTFDNTGTSFGEDGTFTSNSGPTLCVEYDNKVRYVPEDDVGGVIAQMFGIALGVQLLNLVVLQGLTGASIGKFLTGLRVVREDGSKAGIGAAIVRWLILIVDGACFFLPGAILVFTTRGHRRLGDMATSTNVVRTADVGRPTMAGVLVVGGPGGGWNPPPAASAPPSAGAPATGSGPQWDAARNAHIQYDQAQGGWVQWHDQAQEWRPIDQ